MHVRVSLQLSDTSKRWWRAGYDRHSGSAQRSDGPGVYHGVLQGWLLTKSGVASDRMSGIASCSCTTEFKNVHPSSDDQDLASVLSISGSQTIQACMWQKL